MSLFTTPITTTTTTPSATTPATASSSTGLTSVTSSRNNTGSGVTNTVKSAAAVVSSAQEVVQSAITSVSKLFSDGENALSNTATQITSSLFGDSSASNSTAGSVKTPIADPVSSNFSQGTPKATIFKTTNATTALTPTNLTGKTTSQDSNILGSLPSLITRYGNDIVTSTVGGVSSVISSTLKSNAVTGTYSAIGTVTKTISATESGVKNVITSAEGVIGSGVTDFRALTAGIARTLTGNDLGLDGMYNAGLPVTATSTGAVIDGIPSTLSTTTLQTLISSMKGLGCSVGNIDLNAYGAEQSLYAGLLGLCSELNITSLLKNLLNCNRFDSNMQSIGAGLFNNYAGTNATVANTILTALPSTSVASTQTLGKTIVSNSNVTTAQVSDVTSMLTTLSITPTEAMSTGITVNGEPVYDTSTLDAMSDPLITHIDPTGDLSKMTNGQELALAF